MSSPVAVVVRVVSLENSEGLGFVGSGVVRALGGLDVIGALRGGAFEKQRQYVIVLTADGRLLSPFGCLWAFAFAVRACWIEGGRCARQRERQADD